MSNSSKNSTIHRSDTSSISNRKQQARYWIATIPFADWQPHLPDSVAWVKGQRELGDGGYDHWQFVFSFTKKTTLSKVRTIFPTRGHYEPTRSDAAINYCTKLETRIGEPFEFGTKVFNPSCSTDWQQIRENAMAGNLEEIPPEIFIRYYHSLRSIRADYTRPAAVLRTCTVYWGETGAGKSRRAWDEGGSDSYPKCPRSKFWCGYSGQSSVILDEFRGGIDVSHILRFDIVNIDGWTDIRLELRSKDPQYL